MVQFERINATPVGPLIRKGRITAVGRIFRQDDNLWVSSDDRFVCDLGITTATAVAMEDIGSIGILQEFIAKGTPAKDIGFSRRTIVYF